MQNIQHLQKVYSSTVAAFHSRSSGSSSATSLWGVSRPQNVSAGILVSIMDRAALRTGPRPYVQWQPLHNVATSTTALTARKEPIHGLQCLPVPRTLIGKHLSRISERSISKRLCQMPVTDHAPDVQVFDADGIEPPHQVRRHLMQVVRSGIRDLGLYLRHPQPRPLPAARVFLSAREDALRLRQFPLIARGVFGIGNAFARRQRRQSVQTEVDAHGCFGFRQLRQRLLQTQCDEIAARAILSQRNGARRTHKGATPADMQPSDLGNSQGLRFRSPGKCRPSVLRRLLPTLTLEGGILCPLLKERLEGGLQMPQRLLRGDARDLAQPGGLWLFLQHSQGRRRGVIIDRLPALVTVGAQAQPKIVNVAACAEGPRQQRELFRRRVAAESIADFVHTKYSKRVSQPSQDSAPSRSQLLGFRAENFL